MKLNFQFSEQTLFAAGFDRPTVEAFRHLLKAVGNIDSGITLPAAATEIEALALLPSFQAAVAPDDYLTPPVVALPAQDELRPLLQMVEQVEFLQTEVRQLAEQVAALNRQINDLQQGTSL